MYNVIDQDTLCSNLSHETCDNSVYDVVPGKISSKCKLQQGTCTKDKLSMNCLYRN